MLNGAESTEQEVKTCRNTPSPDQLRTAASIFLLAVHGNLTIVAALIYIYCTIYEIGTKNSRRRSIFYSYALSCDGVDVMKLNFVLI